MPRRVGCCFIRAQRWATMKGECKMFTAERLAQILTEINTRHCGYLKAANEAYSRSDLKSMNKALSDAEVAEKEYAGVKKTMVFFALKSKSVLMAEPIYYVVNEVLAKPKYTVISHKEELTKDTKQHLCFVSADKQVAINFEELIAYMNGNMDFVVKAHILARECAARIQMNILPSSTGNENAVTVENLRSEYVTVNGEGEHPVPEVEQVGNTAITIISKKGIVRSLNDIFTTALGVEIKANSHDAEFVQQALTKYSANGAVCLKPMSNDAFTQMLFATVLRSIVLGEKYIVGADKSTSAAHVELRDAFVKKLNDDIDKASTDDSAPSASTQDTAKKSTKKSSKK